MKSPCLKKSRVSVFRRCIFIFQFIILFFFCLTLPVTKSSAQAVLFDFNNAPQYSSLPINQTAGGITAHFSATGQGFSIQNANTMGFTPSGFDGLCIYPNSINLADLLISFDHTLSAFSIMYACQELGCDDAAMVRVTAYMNGNLVGTSTKTASNPGTWPSDTLRCSFPQGFNSVVIHYDHRPPTCQDYGVIFMADKMLVTAMNGPITLVLTIFIEGFYSGNGTMVAVADPVNYPYLCDTIMVELRNVISPYSSAYSVSGTIDIYGNGSFVFPGSIQGNSYYLVIHHRNSIETWSKLPVVFNSSMINFDFTSP
jgi:hypothetical protein